ncbi:MAG: alpha/beta hydrolase [Chlorobiaceae bacterium]|nr:alpha/beta hydrolase [Chlorobiaceae bacterium]
MKGVESRCASGGAGPYTDSVFIDIGGFTLHCRIAGKGMPLLIFLHGSFLSVRSWRHVFDALSEHATVVAFDRPAFGLTSKPRASEPEGISYGPEAQADLVAELIGRLGFEKAVLAGNSTGGTLALLAALRHPGRVEGIVLADAMIYSGYATSGIPAFMKPAMKTMSPLFAGIMKIMISRLYNRVIRSMWYRKERLGEDLLASFRCDLMNGDWSRAFWEVFIETHHLRLDEKLKTLDIPVLVMTGEHDVMVRKAESLRLARELPSANLSVFADCGHLPQEEKPEEFIAALKEFLHKIRDGR